MFEVFFGKIAQSLIVSYTKEGLKLVYGYRYLLNSQGRYKKLLATTLAQMPFIYKDVDLEVLEDYVDIEVQFVDTDNLKPLKVLKNNKPLEKLNQNYKALFIGSAGMGKSTFFRYSTISLIKKKYPYFLSSVKKQTPVFISLKAVPNFGKSPILNSILNELPFLKNDGVNKLRRLTAKGKLFFLLDGYDEISFAASTNHIRYELGLLLSTSIDKNLNQDFIDPRYLEIYENITRNTVWLSTREEFYRLNPIGIKASVSNEYSTKNTTKDFIAVQLRGLGDNRLVLVRKIFDKYRARSKRFNELLDEEVFIEEIDTHEDEELVKLSKRPLFLTILCYIHVTNLISNGESGRDWIRYLNELVLECIKVLLSDLDKFKVRDYSAEQKKTAFVKRRSNFLEQKTEFLKFFAFEMLLSGENIFDAQHLEKYVRIFFKERYQGEQTAEILSELDRPRSNNPNIVVQLLYSGIFVVANANPENLLYDFPHRRFKEVLATEALRDPEIFEYFLGKITNRNLSEFVLLVFRHYKDRRRIIIEKLFESCDAPENQLYNTQLIMNLLVQNPSFKIDAYLLPYLKKAIESNRFITIYFELIEKGRDSYYSMENLILEAIGRYKDTNSFHSLNTAFEILEIVAPFRLEMTLGELERSSVTLELKATIKKFHIKALVKLSATPKEIHDICLDDISLITLSTIEDKYLNESFYIPFFKLSDTAQLLSLWFLLAKNNQDFSGRRLSSIFNVYKMIFDAFNDFNSLDSFINHVLQSLQHDINALSSLLDSMDKKVDKSGIRFIKEEILGLQSLMKKIGGFSETKWAETKDRFKVYAESDYRYLFNRIDKHRFYYLENTD